MNQPQQFLYGTQYWRPPNPPRDQHRFHLEKIKNELGFDLVRVWVGWNWHNRRTDDFDFDEVDEIFDVCDRIGLRVLLQLSLENAPYWLEREHPNSRYVNANGRPIELGAQEATPCGGHPGLCFHNEPVLRHAERFLRQAVRQFKDRRSLYVYDCWNEPHLEPVWCNNMWGNVGDRVYCYCDASREEFRSWLGRRYGDVETFNNTWGRAYCSLDHVQPPILQGHYADWLDWMRFWFDQLHQNMRWRVDVIKQEDPTRMVISHSGAVPPVLPRANACIHNWKFARAVDLWGTSFAPQGFSWDLATCAQVIEVTRSAAGEKDFWVSEMPGGPSNIRGFRKSRIPRPRDYHLWNWLAAALGSKGTVHWCYLTERTGQEAGGYGMVRLDGQHTDRSLAIARTAALLKKHQDILLSARVPTQVAVLYDPDNSSILFAMELEDELYGRSHIGYYRAIWRADLTARYVTYDTLEEIREKVLIVPMALTMPEDVADKIARFVHDGGTLIAEARTGMYDHRGWLRAQLPAGELSRAAGLREGEMVCSDMDNRISVSGPDGSVKATARSDLPAMDPIHLGPPISFTWPLPAEIPVHGFLTPLELNGAEPMGKYGDTVLAARHKYGKGEVYYFGTYLGLALDKNIPDAHSVIQHILLKHAQPVIRGDKLRPRLIRGSRGTMLVVFNDHRTETTGELISLPDGFTDARDVVTGEKHKISEGKLSASVEAEDALVLLLEPTHTGERPA